MSATAGVGQFLSWDGGCLLIGSAVGVIPTHAHYAIQIAFGAKTGIRFRTDDGGEWTEYGGAIIPSRQPHSMDATGVGTNAVLFIEPETPEGRALAELHLRDGIAPLPDAVMADCVPALFSAWQERSSARTLEEGARRVIRALTGGVEPSVVSDERILRAIAYINAHLHAPLTLDEVADEACLSPSRFRHLFVEQTGTAFRPYVLWRRFLHIWPMLRAGHSLSAAAHRAGFADAAHLTRTSRRMFGFPPSALHVGVPLRADPDSAVGLPAPAQSPRQWIERGVSFEPGT